MWRCRKEAVPSAEKSGIRYMFSGPYARLEISMSITVSMLLSYLPESAEISCPHPENEILGIKSISELGSRYNTAYLYIGRVSGETDLTEYENLSVILYSEEKKIGDLSGQEENNVIFLSDREEYEKLIDSIFAVLNHGHIKSVMSEELLSMLKDGCELQEIMDYGYRKLQNPILLVDASFNYLASAGMQEDVEEPVWEYTIRKGFMPEAYLRCIESEQHSPEGKGGDPEENDDILRMKEEYKELIRHRMTSIRITRNRRVIGYLSIMERYTLVTEYDISLLRLLGGYLSIELAKSVGQSSFNFTLIESFLLSVLKDNIENPEEIEVRQKLFDIRLRENLYVITVEISEEQTEPDEQIHLLSRLKKHLGCSNAVLLDGRAVVICDTERTEAEFCRQVLPDFSSLMEVLECRAGVSYPFGKLRDLYAHYQQTLHCLEMSDILEIGSSVLRYDDVIDYHMIFSFGKIAGMETLLHPAARILLRVDRENDSDYAETLFTYISCGQNLSDSARMMGVHYNTLKYRINRIIAMTGLDLKDERTIFKLMVTERALRILRRPESGRTMKGRKLPAAEGDPENR